MLQHTASKDCRFILIDSEANQAVATVKQTAVIEAQITGEKGWTTLRKQKGHYPGVFCSLLPDVDSNLANPDAPTLQKLALALQDVLVQDVHAGVGSNTYS
jgi:hypothetical protein